MRRRSRLTCESASRRCVTRVSCPGSALSWLATIRRALPMSPASTVIAQRLGSRASNASFRRPSRRLRSRPSSTNSTPTRAAPATSSSCRCREVSTSSPCSSGSIRRKDADGLHPSNLGRLVLMQPGPLPCTPRACVELMRTLRRPHQRRRCCRRRSRRDGRAADRAATYPPQRERDGHLVPHRHGRSRRSCAAG